MANLVDVLGRSQELGFLGPGPVEEHIEHAARYKGGISFAFDRAMDLGSGGGVPGLVLAMQFPTAHWTLVDAMAKRCTFLEWARDELALPNVDVVLGRAEELARRDDLRQAFDLVVARSFGKPAVTAECATGFLSESGHLIVSEPPSRTERWDEPALTALGLKRLPSASNVAHLVQFAPCSDEWPRKNGVPAKRPLF